MVAFATGKRIAITNINRLIANGVETASSALPSSYHGRARWEWCRAVLQEGVEFTAVSFDINAANILYGGTSDGQVFVFNTRSKTFSDGRHAPRNGRCQLLQKLILDPQKQSTDAGTLCYSCALRFHTNIYQLTNTLSNGDRFDARIFDLLFEILHFCAQCHGRI